MKYLFILILFISSSYAMKNYHEGTIKVPMFLTQNGCQKLSNKQSKIISEICIKDIKIDYKLSILMGEPTQLYIVKWEIEPLLKLKNAKKINPNKLPYSVSKSFKNLTIISPSYFTANIKGKNIPNYTDMMFDGDYIGKSEAEGFSVTGSPDWNKFIIDTRKSLYFNKKEITYIKEEHAKTIMKTPRLKLHNLKIHSLTFGNIDSLNRALKKDCSWRIGKNKKICLKNKNNNKFVDDFENDLDSIEEKESISKNNSNDDFDSIESHTKKINTQTNKYTKKLHNKILSFEKIKNKNLNSCSKNKPLKPNSKWKCSGVNRGFFLWSSDCDSKCKKKIYAKHRKEDKEFCRKVKRKWENDISTYPSRLKKWEYNKNQCIKIANSNYRQSIKKMKNERKEIEQLEKDFNFD